MQLRPHQTRALDMLKYSLGKGHMRPMVQAPTGFGKCLDPQTKVIFYDGSVRPVSEIKAGDTLLGDDNTPRTVLAVSRGESMMYKITPVKGDSWRCNENHILTLVSSGDLSIASKGEVIDIDLPVYLELNKTAKHCLKQFAVGFDGWSDADFSLDPYFVGLWLGDGSRRSPIIHNPDSEIISYLCQYGYEIGVPVKSYHDVDNKKCASWRFTTERGAPNPVWNCLKEFLIQDEKYIPLKYLTSSKNQRSRLLAGLLDTDGYYHNGSFEICQKSKPLSDAICILARSLGFRVINSIKLVNECEYQRLTITGDFRNLPLRVARKRPENYGANRNPLRTGFSVEPDGYGDYVGIVVDGNNRFLLADFTVVHNTVLGQAIVNGALAKGNRVIFCVPAVSLIDQTVQSFWNAGIRDIGVIQADHAMTNPSMPIQVASIQTLHRRQIPDADVVIVDEAHRWFKFYERWMKLWDAVPFVGLSATPWTKGLGKYYDDLIIAATTQELIDAGYLSDFRVYAPSHPDLSKVKIRAGDYAEDQLAQVMNENTLVGDAVSDWKQRGENRPTLCFCVDRAHAKHMQERFKAAGVPTGYIDAYTDREEREDIRKKFHSGELKVVCNVGCLTTGVDWDVRCIVLCRPTKSEILFTQIIGRGLRTADGKEDCIILDHSDTHLRLGFVTDIHHEKLDDGQERKNAKAEPRERLPKECPSCSFLKPAKVHECPACGFKPEKQTDVQAGEGKLEELKRKKKTNREMTSDEKARFYGELKTWAKDKGYSEGWASHKYKEKTGVWPNSYRGAPPVEVSEATKSWIISQQIKYAKSKAKRGAAA